MADAILARIRDGPLPMHFFRRVDVDHIHHLTEAGSSRRASGRWSQPGKLLRRSPGSRRWGALRFVTSAPSSARDSRRRTHDRPFALRGGWEAWPLPFRMDAGGAVQQLRSRDIASWPRWAASPNMTRHLMLASKHFVRLATDL